MILMIATRDLPGSIQLVVGALAGITPRMTLRRKPGDVMSRTAGEQPHIPYEPIAGIRSNGC